MRQFWNFIWPWARKASEVTPSLTPPLTEEEVFLVMEFRRLKAMGMQRGGTVGGCGGCPSAGECGPEIV